MKAPFRKKLGESRREDALGGCADIDVAACGLERGAGSHSTSLDPARDRSYDEECLYMCEASWGRGVGEAVTQEARALMAADLESIRHQLAVLARRKKARVIDKPNQRRTHEVICPET